MEQLSDPIVIGLIGAPHGVRGTIRVRAAGTGLHLREGIEPAVNGTRRRILSARLTPKGYLVDLEGIADRSQAAALRGKELILDRSELDELEEEEFYVGDLIGMEAVNGRGEALGVIEEVVETPAHEILVLRKADGEIYVPFTREHVPELEPERRRVVVIPPEAL